MTNERVSYLLTQYLEKRITEAELHELSALLLEHEENEAFQATVEAMMRNTPGHSYSEMEWEPMLQQITQKAPVRRLAPRWLPYAAAVLLMIAAGWYFWPVKQAPDQTPVAVVQQPVILPATNKAVLQLGNKHMALDSSVKQLPFGNNSNGQLNYAANNPLEYHTLSTPRGGQYQLTLPDGTKIWLNAASSIHYPTAFTGTERIVDITGEAYFEVAKNAHQPFIVRANGTEVKVLGTHFNVNAYDRMVCTLLEGKVQIGNSVLKPGQEYAGGLVRDADIEKAVAWKNGLFDFNGADLTTAMRELERWYDIQVKYEGSTPPITFHGKMDRNVNLSQMLDILTRMEVKYKQEGRTLTITP